MMRPLRCGADTSSRFANPRSKSLAIPKPVNTPPNTADCRSTNTNWNPVYPPRKSNPGTCLSRDRPPANATKFASGNSIGGSNSDGFLSRMVDWR